MSTVQEILNKKTGAEIFSMVGAESVLNAARLMNERGVGCVVITEDGNMVGIFTERDILRRVVAEQRDPGTTELSEVMTSPVATCVPETTLDECIGVMTGKRIRHIPVLVNNAVSGMITSGDLLAYQVKEHEDTIQYLKSYVFDMR
jgi:CBS domain-containing protein